LAKIGKARIWLAVLEGGVECGWKGEREEQGGIAALDCDILKSL
jgi:hypothetical protein